MSALRLCFALILAAYTSHAASIPIASNGLIPVTNATHSTFDISYANSSIPTSSILSPSRIGNEIVGFTYIIPNSKPRRILRGNYNTSRPIDIAALHTIFQDLLATLELNIEYFGDGPLTENPYTAQTRGCYSIITSLKRVTDVSKMTYGMVLEVVKGLQINLEGAGKSYETKYYLEDVIEAGNIFGNGRLYKRRPRDADEVSSS